MNKNKIEIISSIAMIGILSFMMMIIFSKFIYEKIEFKSKTISNDEIEKSDKEIIVNYIPWIKMLKKIVMKKI